MGTNKIFLAPALARRLRLTQGGSTDAPVTNTTTLVSAEIFLPRGVPVDRVITNTAETPETMQNLSKLIYKAIRPAELKVVDAFEAAHRKLSHGSGLTYGV